MARTIIAKSWCAALILASFGCQNLRPEEIALPNYPDLGEVYTSQYRLLGKLSLQKEISLEQEIEASTFEMDSAKWKKELAFLKEINPRKPEYVGIYRVEKQENKQVLRLAEGENSILKIVRIEYLADDFLTVEATIHEDKDVYVHHRDIKVSFSDGVIDSWKINGYQKIMLKDTIRFAISGKVN